MTGHQSVLLSESIEALNIVSDGIYVDGTFGRGGHSQAILDKLGPNGRLIAIDKDIRAIEWGKRHFGADTRFSIHHCSFADLGTLAEHLNIKERVNGILLDLGVSSPQLDEAERGFSFMQDGPLDMRMDERAPLDAQSFVNESSVELMMQVFKEYGEEKFSRRIAFAIEKARAQKPITRTLELAEIVKAANPKWEKHKHPATRVFQAIRIYINAELSDLETLLTSAYEILSSNGRLAVISFHSLEDRIVKNFFRNEARGAMIPVEIPVKGDALDIRFKKIGKAIKPSENEIKHNVRARSAVLRSGEKLA